MTDLETLTELTEDCGLMATVEITPFNGVFAALIKPTLPTSPKTIFTLLEPLCKEISFAVPSVRYAIVSFGDDSKTVVDCFQYQKLSRLAQSHAA